MASWREVKHMGLLEIIALVLVVLWLGGFSLHIAGGFIHILLVIAVVVFILRFFRSNA
jgi:hypothetical protein